MSSLNKTRRRVFLRAAAFFLAVIAAAGWALHTSYLQSRRHAEDDLRGMAQLLAKGIEGSFRESDYVLRDVIGYLEPGKIRFPDPDAEHVKKIHRLLTEKTKSLPNIYGIGIMNDACIVAYAAREAAGFNLGKKPACLAMHAQEESDTYISSVYQGSQNFLQVELARKIRHPDGRLAGAALLRMDMGFFDGWLRDMEIGPHGSAVLLDLDLNLVARRPAVRQLLGKPINDENLRRFVAENRADATYQMRSPVDGVERIFVVHRLEGAPLLVVTGLSSSEVFSEWAAQSAWFAGGVLLLLLVSALATRHYLVTLSQADALSWSSQAVNASDDAIIITDAQGVIEYVNPAFTAMSGYTCEEVVGETPRVLKSGCQDDDFYRRLWRTIVAGTPWRGELRNRHKNGDIFCDLMSISPVKDDKGQVVRFVAIHHDITQRKRMEDELAQLAHFDLLTGLPNRMLFFDRAERVIAEARRAQGGFSVLFVDLDGFKAVNDLHGHETGDALLREVASQLLACVRESDTVARYGGDEFAVLLRTVCRHEEACIVAQKIIDAVSAPLEVLGHPCQIGASVGVATYPDDGVDVESLLRSADFAMYQAKQRGKNRWIYAGDLI